MPRSLPLRGSLFTKRLFLPFNTLGETDETVQEIIDNVGSEVRQVEHASEEVMNPGVTRKRWNHLESDYKVELYTRSLPIVSR